MTEISRRTALAAGVWSVPVVAVAVAAPSAAASIQYLPASVSFLEADGDIKWYQYEVSNPTSDPLTITAMVDTTWLKFYSGGTWTFVDDTGDLIICTTTLAPGESPENPLYFAYSAPAGETITVSATMTAQGFRSTVVATSVTF